MNWRENVSDEKVNVSVTVELAGMTRSAGLPSKVDVMTGDSAPPNGVRMALPPIMICCKVVPDGPQETARLLRVTSDVEVL